MRAYYVTQGLNGRTFDAVRPLLRIGVVASLVAALATLVSQAYGGFFGFNYSPTARTWVVFLVLTYLVGVLMSSLERSSSAVPILIIPFVTHYYQTDLGWDVATDASSFVRLLPLILMALIMWIRIFRDRPVVTRLEALFLSIWVIASLGWAMFSYFLGLEIVPGALFFAWFLLPGLYYFIKGGLKQSKKFPDEIMLAIYIGFWIFVVGTLLTSLIGLDYRGSSSLLSVRSLNDTNSVVGYISLMWPFALRADQSLFKGRSLPLMVAGFLLVVVLSFSRGAFLLSLPLLVVTLVLCQSSFWQIALLFALSAVMAVIVWPLYGDAILYSWSLRMNVSGDDFSIFRTLYEHAGDQFAESGRYEIWSAAQVMFADSPIVGNGFGSLRSTGYVVAGFSGAHSLFFHTLAELGIVGFLFIYGLLAAVFVRMLRLLMRTAGAGRRFLLVMLCSFISWFVFAHTVGADVMTLFGAHVNAITLVLVIVMLFPKTYASTQ